MDTERRSRPASGANFYKHGLSHLAEHNAWCLIFQRCYNPKCRAFHNYGGRGIKVHERWHNFENFLADMGRRPAGMSLDRINNDGDYAPGNCRWATRKQQARNARFAQNATHEGRTQCLKDWAAEAGIPYLTFYTRLRRYGWSFEDALNTPVTRTARWA